MVFEFPVPEIVALPGYVVRVQVPVEGSPVRTALPVDCEQSGCVTDPNDGAEGVSG
jgi:hypothetical protein